jgi:hypothetical protein
MEALVLAAAVLVAVWLMRLARSSRREEIAAAKHGPNLEMQDRTARFVAALMELSDRRKRDRDRMKRGGLTS